LTDGLDGAGKVACGFPFRRPHYLPAAAPERPSNTPTERWRPRHARSQCCRPIRRDRPQRPDRRQAGGRHRCPSAVQRTRRRQQAPSRGLRETARAGHYVVRWIVLAGDGDQQRATFRFTVR